MNSYVIAGIVMAAAIAFVAAPLARRGKSSAGALPPAEPRPREIRETPRPSALEEIELDFAMGKLEKAEYEALRARYASESSTDAARGPTAIDVERTPASPDTATPVAPDPSAAEFAVERAEAMIRAQSADVVACATCGPRPEPDARFCSTCGRTLDSCPACGAPIEESSGRYCTSCGSALAS